MNPQHAVELRVALSAYLRIVGMHGAHCATKPRPLELVAFAALFNRLPPQDREARAPAYLTGHDWSPTASVEDNGRVLDHDILALAHGISQSDLEAAVGEYKAIAEYARKQVQNAGVAERGLVIPTDMVLAP